MTDRAVRIRQLIDGLDKLDTEKDAVIQHYESRAVLLREELNTLRVETYLEQTGGLQLNSGDKLLVTDAFWHEKRFRGVARNFDIDDKWDVGKSAPVESLEALVMDSDGTLGVTVVIQGEVGAGTTGVGYYTALDMREAWLKANA